MDLSVNAISGLFYTLMWPMLRISALLVTAPFFGLRGVPLRIRILLALALTGLIYPTLEWPTIDPTTARGLLEVVNQIFIGAAMGLILQIIVAGFVLAGQAISNAIGMSIANLIDPTLGNVPVLSQFLLILGALIFFGTGGHLALMATLLKSFTAVPIGQSLFTQETAGQMVAWSSMMFLSGLLIALPVLAAMLVINVGLGVVTRAAPSLNIFAVGFPAMIATGLLAFMLSMESTGARIQSLWAQTLLRVADLVGVR